MQDDDEAGFVDQIRAHVFGILHLYRPAELFLIKTNNWFGPNWLHFSGKVLGQLGVWRTERPTVPPFVPHRIVWERRYAGPEYKQIPIRDMVHVETPSNRAVRRFMQDVAPSASMVWYSGASKRTGRGAMMAYLFVEGSYWTWYVGWQFEKAWKIVKSVGVTIDELAQVSRNQSARR